MWQRHTLLTKHYRLLRLDKATAERQIGLIDEQVRLLERFRPEFRKRHIMAPHIGALIEADTFFVGDLKRVRKAYLRAAIDLNEGKPLGITASGPTGSRRRERNRSSRPPVLTIGARKPAYSFSFA